jgi:hypothetical protein
MICDSMVAALNEKSADVLSQLRTDRHNGELRIGCSKKELAYVPDEKPLWVLAVLHGRAVLACRRAQKKTGTRNVTITDFKVGSGNFP